MALTKNRVTGLVSLIVGIIYFIATRNLPETAVSDPIGPKVFPTIVSIGMILVGMILVLKKEVLTEKNRAVVVKWPADKEIVINIGYTCVAGLVFGLLLEPVGYLICSFLFMTAMMFITNGLRVFYNIAVGLIFSCGTYGVFFSLLEVSLPRGILAF